jgi:hypothetical protein
MKIEFEIRLTICANGCPVGPRLQRGKPMPNYAYTYSMTPEGLKQAQNDMAAVEAYVVENSKIIKRK